MVAARCDARFGASCRSKGQKNDYNDVEAIAEAALRPNLKTVAEKSRDQFDLQALHRVRTRLVSRRTCFASSPVPLPWSGFQLPVEEKQGVTSHHRRHRQSMWLICIHFFCTFNALKRVQVRRLHALLRPVSLPFDI